MNTEAALADNKPARGQPHQRGPKAWKLLLLFVCFSLIISLASNFIFQSYKKSIKRDKQDELAAIAELKIGQITNWIAERKGDAQSIKDDPLFLAEVEGWLQQGGLPGEASSKLARRLASLQQSHASYGYTMISLFDDKAGLRLSSSADEEPLGEYERERALESMRTGQITFSEIHREKHRGGEVIEIDLVTPLMVNKGGKIFPIGVVFFRIDPQRFLFPLIQRWPTPSASAENLLVRRDGDEVVFLNKLRHRDNTPLAMHAPLTPGLPATMAIVGQEGLVEGVDYRGVRVVGVLSKVVGTSWFMVNKMDKAEIYAPINHLANWLVVLMLGLVGTGGGISIYWREKEKKHYESELERQSLIRHLDYLSKYANDIILLLDHSGKIADFNDRALEAYGYSAAEFAALNISDLRTIDFLPPLTDQFEEIDRLGALRFEAMHVRRNGENFPVEASVRLVNIAGEKFYQGILRDITERKLAENELGRKEQFIRQVIDSNPNLIFVKDAQGKFLLANEAMAKSYGQTTDGIIGKCNADFVQDPELAAAYDSANREVLDQRHERVALEAGILADGKKHWFQTIRKPLEQDDGSLSVLTIAMDITELKQAEQDQHRMNRALRLLSSCNAVLAHAEEEAQLVDACKLIVDMGGYRMAWVGYAEHDTEKTVRPAMQYGFEDGYLDDARISWADTERGRGPVGLAIRTGVVQVNQDFRNNPQLLPWREAALARGYQSSIALPLRNDSKTFGALTIYSAEPNAFNADEVNLLQELANNLAYGITTQRLRTERKLAEAQLKDERTRLRTLVQTIPDLVWLKDTEGVFLSCNPQLERLYGAREADIIGKTDYDFVDAALADFFRQKDREAMAAGKPSVNEEWVSYPDNGQRVLLETIKVPILDGAAQITGVMGIARDITARKRAEEELKFKNTLLATQQEATIDSILVVDEDGDIISFNRRFVDMWAVPAEAVASKSNSCVIQALLTKLGKPEQFLEKVQYLYQHPQQTSQDEIRLRDGRVLDYYTAPMNGSDGAHYGRVWHFRDITARKHAEDRESRLRHILDSTLNMIFIFRPDSLRFVYLNRGAVDSIGYSNEELLLMTPPDIEPLLPEPAFRKLIAPLVAGKKNTLRFETTHKCKNGTDFPVEVQLQLVQDNTGENVFVSIVRDITERKLAEKELHGQKAFMWQVIDSDPNQIFVKDAQGMFLLANQSLASAYNLTPGQVVGKSQAEITPSSGEAAAYLALDREVIAEGRETSLIEPCTLPDGSQRWYLTVKKRLAMPDGKLGVLGIAADITQQKLAEIKLAESYRKLQRLSLHLESVRADERAKIALNLHDEMGATLVAIKMGVAWLASKLPAEAPQLSAEVARITELVSGGIHTMHQIASQLRPNLLGDVGLAAAIKDYVKKFRQNSNIECILALPEEEFALNADQSLTLFRILQESLNNVAKHAQASKVNIHFTKRGGSLLMVVKDNGIGFDPSTHKEQSLGLLGIRERALMVGGKARISSTPGKGTRVSVSVPHLAPRLDYVDMDDA